MMTDRVVVDRLTLPFLLSAVIEKQDQLIHEIMSPQAFLQDVPTLKLKLQSVQDVLRSLTETEERFGSPTGVSIGGGERYIINLQEAVEEAAEIAKEEAQKKADDLAIEKDMAELRRKSRAEREARRDELVRVMADGARELHFLQHELGEDSYHLIRVVVGMKEKD